MIYTITDGGIVYHVTPEESAEERETDRIADEQAREMTQAEALQVIKREAEKIEAIG